MEWAQALPRDLLASHPKIGLAVIWGKILYGDYAEAEARLKEIQSGFQQIPPQSVETQALRADGLALQAIITQAQGKVAEALSLAEQARSLTPPHDLRLTASTALAYGVVCRLAGRYDEAIKALQESIAAAQAIEDHVTAMIAMAHISLVWYSRGCLRLLVEQAQTTIDRAERLSKIAPFMIGSVHAVLGLVYYEWNQLEKALDSLLHGLRLATLAGQATSMIYANVHLARLYQGQGDFAAAARCLHEADEILSKGGPAWARADWIAQQVSWLVAQGKLDEAAETLGTSNLSPTDPVTYRTEVIHLAWLRWMIASHHPDAFSLAQRIVDSAEAGQRNGVLIHALVLGARAGGGEAWLQRARQLAEPEGYQRIFIDESIPVKTHPSTELIVPLTEREREVLCLLAEGLTYAEIATRLVVSVNTVRYHVKGVYNKLGVEKQIQAVERGRELGLI